ncbi:MAG: FecR domain-containing protein [Cyclobacteriaceae bacterium]
MRKPKPEVIERYFINQCTPEEAELVLSWLATSEGQAFYEMYLNRRIQEGAFPASSLPMNEEKALKGIYARIHQRENTRPTKARAWSLRAAAVVLLLLSSWVIWYSLQSIEQTVKTAYGETRNITLEDGTQVILNANSSFSYKKNHPREVWLTGEAFFTVSHTQDDDLFKVHTSDLTVNVLGTEFNVNTRHKKTDVVLSNGRVKLEIERNLKKESLLMQPGDKVTYSSPENVLERKVVQPTNYSSWVKGTVIFDHTPLKHIFQHIEDTYGVRIEVQNPSLLNREFNGEVADNLEMMLMLLQKTFDIKLTQKGDTIYLN